MKFFNDFIASNAFFPVLVGMVIVLVLLFVWILLSGKKKIDRSENTSTVNNVIESNEPPEVPELTNENIDNVSSQETAQEVVNSFLEGLPINKMDETPVDVIEPVGASDDVGEMIEVEHTQPLVEENVPEDEIVNIDIPVLKGEDKGEEVALPEEKENKPDIGETVELPIIKTLGSESGEEAVAFDQIPGANHDINANVKVETNQEYVGEKTEIFDFPDFKDVDKQDDAVLTGNVENDVIRAANNYISTVFKEN